MNGRGAWILGGLGLAWLLTAWLVSPADLAVWMRHPVRTDGTAASLEAAAWARWGWTAGALTLLAMPWFLRQPGATVMSSAPADRWCLALAMLGSIVLRLLFAGQGLWYDEIASAMTYVVHGPGVVMGNAFTTANHPLQSLLSWCCLPLGVEPWIRLPSVLSGAAVVLGCWWMGRAASPGTSLASGCAVLAAILPAAVNAGAEARGYGLMIASSAMATGLALEGTRAGGRPRWCLYAVVLALGVWAHFVTGMVGLGHAAVAAWMLRRPGSRQAAVRWLRALACATVLAVALWSPALPDLLRARAQFAATRGDEPSLVGHQGLLLIWQWLGMTPLPLDTSGVRPDLAAACGVLPLALILVGVRSCVLEPGRRTALATAGLGVPMAILLAWAGGSWLYARFLLFGVPASVLLLSVGVSRLLQPRAGSSRMPGLLAAGSLAAICLAFTLLSPARQPIREAVAWVAKSRSSGEQVVGIGIADDVVQWYALAFDTPIEPTGLGGTRLREVLARTDAKWIVALYPRHRHPDASGMALADLGFRPRPAHGFVGWLDAGEGTVEIWTREPAP